MKTEGVHLSKLANNVNGVNVWVGIIGDMLIRPYLNALTRIPITFS